MSTVTQHNQGGKWTSLPRHMLPEWIREALRVLLAVVFAIAIASYIMLVIVQANVCAANLESGNEGSCIPRIFVPFWGSYPRNVKLRLVHDYVHLSLPGSTAEVFMDIQAEVVGSHPFLAPISDGLRLEAKCAALVAVANVLRRERGFAPHNRPEFVSDIQELENRTLTQSAPFKILSVSAGVAMFKHSNGVEDVSSLAIMDALYEQSLENDQPTLCSGFIGAHAKELRQLGASSPEIHNASF